MVNEYKIFIKEPFPLKSALAKKLQQVPKEYLVVGIDPHKKKHAAAAITQDFSTVARFKFDNTRAGIESVLEWIKEVLAKSNCRGVMFAIETGGQGDAVS